MSNQKGFRELIQKIDTRKGTEYSLVYLEKAMIVTLRGYFYFYFTGRSPLLRER